MSTLSPLPPGYQALAADPDLADKIGVVGWAVLLRLARLMEPAAHVPGGWWIRATQRRVIDSIKAGRRVGGDLGRGSIQTALDLLEVEGLVRRQLPVPRGHGMGSDAGGWWASWHPSLMLPEDLRPRGSHYSTIVDVNLGVVGTPHTDQGASRVRGSWEPNITTVNFWEPNLGTLHPSGAPFPSAVGADCPVEGVDVRSSTSPMHGVHPSMDTGAEPSTAQGSRAPRDARSDARDATGGGVLAVRLAAELERIDWRGTPPAGDPMVILAVIAALDADPTVQSTGKVLRTYDRRPGGVEGEARARGLLTPARPTPTPPPYAVTMATLEAQLVGEDRCPDGLPWSECGPCREAAATLRARARGQNHA